VVALPNWAHRGPDLVCVGGGLAWGVVGTRGGAAQLGGAGHSVRGCYFVALGEHRPTCSLWPLLRSVR